MEERTQAPLWTPPLVVYTALAAAYFAVILLPGRPSYPAWGIAASALIEASVIWLLLKRSRPGWWLALGLGALGVLECLAQAIRTGGAAGWIAMAAIQAASMVVLVWLWTPRLTQVV